MHATILGAALIAAAMWATTALGATPNASPADCPKAPRALVERFIDADCSNCWTTEPSTRATPDAWLLDWIVPGSRGDDSPLAPAAPPEAKQRTERIPGFALGAGGHSSRRTSLKPMAELQLRVVAGPAWNGYFALQLDAKGRWPRRSTGWLALLEVVPPGTDGTPVARHLVRAVAGPLDLDALRDGRSVRALRALRWPETARPERLRARAWIEATDGHILLLAGEGCTS